MNFIPKEIVSEIKKIDLLTYYGCTIDHHLKDTFKVL